MVGGLEEAQEEQEWCEDQRRAADYLDCCYMFWVVLRHRKNRSCVLINEERHTSWIVVTYAGWS
jgi:hypothetical protein